MTNRMVPGHKTENHQKTFKMAAKSKMAVKIYSVIFFSAFDIITLKSNVIPDLYISFVQVVHSLASH